MIDPLISSIAANYFSSLSYPLVEKSFKNVFKLKPNLENKLRNAKSNEDFEQVFKEAIGVIDVQANAGGVEIDSSFLSALRGIRFDHQNGSVSISNSDVHAPILQMGGTGNGKTEITGSKLISNGAQVHVGGGASIKITGNAQMKIS